MSPPRSPLALRVRRALLEEAIVPAGSTVLVAVSGGSDSVALLHLLAELAPEQGLALHAAHLNHGLRGERADADAAFTRDLCRRLGVPATVERRPVARHPRESPQEAARRVRYAFLEEVAERVGAGRIATAHHADDQGETLLMRLITGAGVAGLAGMGPRRGRLIRPLLGVRKAELAAYLRERGIPHVEDDSNRDRRYLRNRIRAEVIPRLTALNPNIADTLARQARLLADEEGYLAERAEAARAQVVEGPADAPRLNGPALCALPPALARRVVHGVLAPLAPGEVTTAHVEAVRDLARGGTGRGVDLPGGWRAEAEYGVLRLFRPTPRMEPRPVPVTVPGLTPVPWAGLTLEARYRAADPEPGWVYFDPRTFSGPLTVRPRRRGERFRPQGMGGHSKSLKRYLMDLKVPRAERGRVPLLTAPEGLLWVIGRRQDERFMVQVRTPERPEGEALLAVRVIRGREPQRENTV